ncbi:lonely Cys domain-containing protein, partial [Streptomyces sp. ADI97-07]|uniref:lonely Cys domain-containing protein n=1 Tax=Streptomyces sp. ADI97-07 TaxID=1522762 RepID=UPI001F14CF26
MVLPPPPAPEQDAAVVLPPPPAPKLDVEDAAAVPLPVSPTGSDVPGLEGEEEAYELSTLSGADAEGIKATDTAEAGPLLLPPSARSRRSEAEALAQFRFTDDTSDTDSDGESEDGAPDTAHEAWLDLLFGPAARHDYSHETLVDTASSLRDLARDHADPSFVATGVLDELHDLTRQVLGLGPDTEVHARHLLLLGSLALSASPDELADARALTSYLTRHDAALGRGTRLVAEDGTGRNWTGTGGQAPPLNSYAMQSEDGGLVTWTAPWSDPYVVLAQESADSVQLVTPRGRLTLDDPGEFARLLARDPARHPGADVVLAFPHDDIAFLARHVADLTGSRVWYSEHGPRPSTDWRSGTDHITVGSVPGGPGTAWTSVGPHQDDDSEGDVADIVDLYEDGSEHAEGADARRPKHLTTTDYGVVDHRGDGVLFRKPGAIRGAWQTPRILEVTEDAPELAMSVQDHRETPATERPALRISSDRTLAVEDGAYGQQVFATAEAVARASADLARSGLAVRLRTDEDLSILLPTPDGNSKQLFRVTPVFLTRSGQSTEEVCRDFADMLADNSRTSHMVFRNPRSGLVVTAPVNASDGVEVTGTHHLADALSQVADGDVSPDTADPAWAASFVRRDDRPTGGDDGPLPGRAYGSALSLAQQVDPRRDVLSDAASRIGVNEHAWAGVGEGYVVQSVAAAGAQGQPSLEHNYAKPQTAASRAHFGYHFATVVLASEDGSHQISLENHARASQRNQRHRRAVTANLSEHGLDDLREIVSQLREEIERRQGTDTDEHLTELRGHLDLALALVRAKQAQAEMRAAAPGSPERAAAERTLEGATRAAASRVGQLERVIQGKHQWYMRMYSQRPGESAHDTNAELLDDKPSAEANPLTAVVLRGQHAPPASISFPKGAQQTPDSATHSLRYLAKVVARTAMWNAGNGLPLPDVKVTGLRSGRLTGRDLAKTRAEAVTALFRQELADALAALQDGTPQPHVTADLVTVVPVSVRGRQPSDGDTGASTVTITVDDHRGGPRHIATRGRLRGGSRHGGLDPMAEQWPIGMSITVMRPRFGAVDPAFVVPASEAPETDLPTPAGSAPDGSADRVTAGTGKGKAPDTATADDTPPTADPRQWFAYTRAAEYRSEPLRYEVADTGHIRLPDGEEIPPTGWTRYGHDFVHGATGAILRGDSGWIGHVANLDTLWPAMADLDPDTAPYRIVADPSALYLVPEYGDMALRIPLREYAGFAVPGDTSLTATQPTPVAPADGTSAPATGPAQPPRARLDDRPRYVVRSAFDVRRFTHGGENVTDLTVRLAVRAGDGQADTDAVMARVIDGVEEFYNRPGHRLPNGDRLHVTVEQAGPDENPHLTVDLVDRDQQMNQRAWWADADPVEFAHELAHQLFLRDETRDASNPGRLHAPGSLLGPFRDQAPEGLAQSGLRPRHLQLWAAVTGDIELHTAPDGSSWADARTNAPAEIREQAWVDPVSLPAASPQTGPDGAVPPPLPPGNPLSTLAEASDESESEPDSDDEDERPLWADSGWLNMLFGPHLGSVPRLRLRETSEALYDLVREEAGGQETSQALRTGLNRVTRRVLHMRSGPGAPDFLLLGSLALDASSDDLASTDDLALYFIERQIETGRGALDEGTLLRDDEGSAVGRDFTGPGQPTPELESYPVRGRGRVVPRPAPWQNPYLVVARAAGRAVEISMPGRTFLVDSAEELAMLISYDSGRPRGADIVLALPPAYAATVATLVAGTTGRRVWYPEAPVTVTTHPTTGTRHLMMDLGDGDTGAGWAAYAPPADGGLTGARDPGSAGDTHSLSDPDSDDGSSSDGDAEFDRLVEQAVLERQIEGRRPRPLTTRDYGVIDKRGTGVLFTRPLPQTVGDVRAGDGTGPDAPALALPYQGQEDIRMADRPPLHISEDRTLAMLAADGDGTAGRSRQVYATRAAIERSSARLTRAGAGVRLRTDESVGVLLPKEDGSYGEPLFRVEPEFLTGSGGPEHAFTRDFARMVAGEAVAPLSHIAFRGPTGDIVSTAPVNGQHGREVTGTHHLALALTEVAEGTRPARDVTPRWASRQAGRDSRFAGGVVGAPTPGERYGSALSYEPQDNPLRTPLGTAARRIGVNEYAWAGVGEGYLIQSISTTNDSGAQLFTHNHAKPGDRVGPHAPYHFAQVVLAAEDGTHQITLENETHSRTGIPAAALDDVIDENLDRYGEDELLRLADEAGQRATEARRSGAGEAETARLDDFARAARALADVHRAEQLPGYFDEDRPEHALALREVAEARSRARELITAAAPVLESKDQWFFRAYSKRPGESAHEANAALLSDASPAVANPLTTVVLHGHTPRMHQRTVRFEEGRRGTPVDADATIDGLALSLARAGLWNRAHGLPMPAVTLTGHGNRSLASGQERADAVAKALAARLAQVLDTFQAGHDGPRVGVRDFALTKAAKRVRSATDPAQGRVVTIDIDDRRLVAPGQSGTATPVGEPARSDEPAVTRPTADEVTTIDEPAVAPPATGGPVTTRSASPEPATTTRRAGSRSPGRSAQPSPERRNSDAPPWVMARIRYAEESVAFDKRLGEYLAEHEAVTAEYRKMASAAWAAARQKYPRALATFGDTSKFKAGVVGTSREALQRVIRSGNLRELVAFLYEGISKDLVPEMLGGPEEQHPEIAAERPSRRQREAYAAYMRSAIEIQESAMSPAEKQAAVKALPQPVADPAHPDTARPPLSEAERRFALDEAGLTWMPATSVYDIAMGADFQGLSEDSGGLVATGTAGSTYRFMLHAARMREQWGLDLDLGLIRAGMLAISLTVGHHTAHEVMRGAQLALNDVPGHDPALDYADNWGRYWNIHPFDEQDLRENVARDGLFPDEHAQALLDELEPKPGTVTRQDGPGSRTALPHRQGRAPRPIHTRPVATEPNHPAPQMPNPPAAHRGTAATPPEVSPHEAEDHRTAVLDALYGLGALTNVDRDRAAAGLERLDGLRAADPELRGGFLDLDALVRRVLLLDPSDTVNAAARGALVRLVTAPLTTGATTLAALSAAYLAQRGAFHADFRLTDAQGRPRGWNWLGRPLPADFDPGSTGRVSRAPDGSTRHSGLETAPWLPTPGHPDPYLVLMGARSDGVVVRGLGGFARPVPPEVLHELMALDRNLADRPGPLLLHVARPTAASLDLPRGLADRLGREVWATTGRSAIGRLPEAPDRSVVLLLDEESQAPRGQWFANTPAMTSTPPADTGDDQISALSVAHHGNRSTGYISMDLAGSDDGGWSRTLTHSRLGRVTSYTFQRTSYDPKGATSPVPWVELNLPAPYFPNNHGLPGSVTWHTPEGERTDDGPQFARRLARRRSLASLAPEHPVALLVCYAAAAPGIGEMHGLHIDGPLPFVPDPLAAVAVGQHTANETGRTVFATTLMNAAVQSRTDDQDTYLSLHTDARGNAHPWVMFRPEPAGDALDRRARDAGLHEGPGPVPEAARERTLRLVRALRQAFGPTVDESPEYPVLLRGIGALDLMREADPNLDRDGARAFTLELYEQLLTGFHTGGLPQGRAPQFTPDGHRALLAEAARRWDAGLRGPLTDWIALPHLVHMLSDLASTPHREDVARHVLGLDVSAQVGEAEWSRLLWASYKVAMVTGHVDPGAFAAAVLHLPALDPARFGEAVVVARRAAAVGRDPWQLSEVAAHHLEQQGALESDRLLTDDDGEAWGRALDGESRPHGTFDPGVVTLLGYAPDGSLVPVGTEPAPWTADPHRPRPFVYVADGDANGLWMQGAVPPQEFGELVFRDPELLAEDGYAEVIAVVPHGRPAGAQPAEGSVPGEGARNSARNWWATHSPTTLHHDPATGTYTVALLPGPDGQPATAGTWGRITPSGGDGSTTTGTAVATNARSPRTAVVAGAGTDLDDAWDAHVRALTALGGAAAAAATTERISGDETAVADAWAGVDEARRALEDAEARLWTLGVAPEDLGAAREAGRDDTTDAGDAAPAVPRDAGERRWIAEQLTEADLPSTPPPPTGEETVGPRELEAGGITLSVGQRTEMALRGDDRLPASALAPLDLVRVRMAGLGAWTATADRAAANASRRLWTRAHADFADAAPEGTTADDTTRAWDAAVSLVLPAEPHDVLADSRYAGDGFREAVGRVAGHLLEAGTGTGPAPASATELADTLRLGLGLRQRWTAPPTDSGEPGEPEQVPVAQSGADADMPDFDMSVPADPGPDSIDFGDFDLSAWDGLDVGDFDFDFDFDLPGTDLAGPTGPDAADVDMTDPEPTGPDMTELDTDGGQPVFVAPTATAAAARPLAPLPRLSLVPYAMGETRPSADAQESVGRVAFQVAKAGLRNLRTRVPLPRIDIAGYGADARGAGTAQEREQAARQTGDRRARTAHELFVRELDDALSALQKNLPAGRTRLTAKDFKITSRGRARVPGQGVTVGSSAPVNRTDLGRQATIALTSPGHAVAVDTLDALRRDDRALRAGAFDVDAVARRILHLDPHVLVDPEMRRDLYTMVERALAAGRATGLAALTAFHLEEEGVLAADRARYVAVGGNRVPGLNWSGPDTVELDTMLIESLTPDQAGGFAPTGGSDFAPWMWDAVNPYAVLADGRHDMVTARLPDGTTRDLDVDEFVELVAADLARQGLPTTTPIVLAVPFAGDRYLELPRKLAGRTGHTVWVHSGLARRNPDPAAVNTIAVIQRDGMPHGSWIPVRPGLAPDAEDGAPDWHRDVLTQPIVSALTGQQIGRSLHEPGELTESSREDNFARLDQMKVFVHYSPATGAYSAKLPLADPGPKEKAYHLAGHGLPGRLMLPLAGGGSKSADRHEAGQWLRRRKSLSSLPEDHWIDMVVCYSSTPQDGATQDLSQVSTAVPVPFAADPLSDDALSMGQHLANETRRTVRMSYAVQGTFTYQGDPVRVLFTDASGRQWWWETSRPEPDEAELDRLAGLAGLPGEPSQRSRTELLRVVRALRLVLGHDVEDADDFATLVRGAAAVVDMWYADQGLGPTGPFSVDLLRRVIAAHPEAAAGVDRQSTRRVLAAAAQARQPGSALPVTGFVDLPVLDSAARWLTDTTAVDATAVAALKLADTGQVGAAERARMFWARVKAEETLLAAGPDADALTTKVLHFDPAVDVDDGMRGAALTLLTRGFAAGRNMSDPDVAAAYDLEARGAFDEPSTFTMMGSHTGEGRDWKDGSAAFPELGRFRAPSGLADAPWAGQDVYGKDKPVPYLVRAYVDLQDNDHLEVGFGGGSYRVRAAEFAELLAADPDLRRKDLNTPVLLVLEGLDGPASGLADLIAQRLGRSVWWSPFPADLSGTDDAGTPVPTLVDSLITLTSPTAADWQEARPVAPAGTQEGLRPVAPPLPAGQLPGTAGPAEDGAVAGEPTAARDLPTGADATVAPPAKARSSAGDPMQGVEMTSAPTLTPPVRTAPAAPPLPALPTRSLVAYGHGATTPSTNGADGLRRLAAQVAATGLRNRKAGASLPRVAVTGYGADARRAEPTEQAATGTRRAQAARNLFRRLLARALDDLQQDRPVGEPRLAVEDFTVGARGAARVPADWVGTGALDGVTRAELGRQATIGISQQPDASAVQTLDSLRRHDPSLRDRPLDIDALARRILHLDSGASVGQDLREELFALVERSRAAGAATSLAALGAFHLTELGVRAPGRARHFTVGGGRVPGLNWDEDAVAELDTANSDVLEDNPSGTYDILDTVRTPWAPGVTPYVVAADGQHDRVEARLPDGSTRDLGVDEFVELVAADVAGEGIAQGTPIVLAIPFAGDRYLDLPRKLADRTGLTVWAHSGDVTLSSAPGAASTLDTVRRPGVPQGDWIASEPGLAPDPDDDAPDWHRDVVTRPLVSALSGKQIGRASHHPAEYAKHFEDDGRHLDRMTTFVHHYPATNEISQEHDLPRPGPEDTAYRLDIHGEPGLLQLALQDGTVRLADEREAGAWLKRRKSLASLPADHWIDLVVCWSGAPRGSAVPAPETVGDAFPGPFVPDPLRDVSMGQHLANSTGRTVRLAYSSQGTRSANGRYTRTLYADAQGRHRAWDLFRPEPAGPALDRLAEIAGFTPRDGHPTEETRERTLRLVRALRLTFGHEVDAAPDFGDLLRGAAAVDHMWRSDSDFDTAGPFTLDLLRRVVEAHPGAASGVNHESTRRVLKAAAEQWTMWPGDVLVGFVDLPAVEAAAQWMRDGDPVAEAADALDIDPDAVGETERSRIFWARVKAEETLLALGADQGAFIAQVLHLPPGSRTGHAERGDATDLLTRAFAAGRQASDPDVAAAYDLEESGVFTTTGLRTVQGGARGGRDFTGGQPPSSVDLAQFRTPAALVDAPWEQGPGVPAPYLVRVAPDAHDPDLLQLSYDGETAGVPTGELLDLLANDLPLMRRDLTTPVVLAFSGPPADAGDVAHRIAQGLGRTVWWTDFPADLSGAGDSGQPVLTLRDSAVVGSMQGTDVWHDARPVQHTAPGDAPRTLPAPVPRSTGRGTVTPDPAPEPVTVPAPATDSGTRGALPSGTRAVPAGRSATPEPAARTLPSDPDWAFAPASDTASAPASPVSSSGTSDARSISPLPSTGAVDAASDPLLSGATLMTDAHGAPRGRDWTGSGTRSVDVSRIQLHELRDGELHRVSDEPAPWGTEAYVVATEGGWDESLIADGRELDPQAAAALLAADPVLASLPRDVPVVLVSPYAGSQYGQLARAVAERLGRRVWAPSGDGRLLAPVSGTTADGTPAAAGAHVPSLVDADPDDAYGDWVPFDPSPDGTGPAVDREWVTADGIRFRDSDVETRPLVGADHRFEGRESMPDDGRRRLRERRLRLYRGMRERAHVLRLGDAYHQVDSEETTPDPEASVHTFHAHGVPGGLKLVHKDGRVLLLGAEDGGRYIGGLPELVARAAGDELHVASCYGAVAGDPLREQSLIRPAPPVEDPLEEVALAQHAANHSGRTTTAATGRTGYNDTVRLLAATPDGTLSRMETFLPEPVNLTAEVTGQAGLRPLPHATGVPAWDDEGPRALRLVRALRMVFGNEAEADRGVPGGRYERLLRGIGALETLRANDPALSPLTPLRMELWELLASSPDGPAPVPADFEAVLDRALAAAPDAALTAVWDAPALRAALDRLASGGDGAARAVLRMPTGPLTPRARARALWAMTGASRLLDAKSPSEMRELGRAVLHLPAGSPWDAPAETRLRELTEQAAAAGRDIGRPGELSVFHLETLGAFAGESRIRTPDGTLQGRNWGSTPLPGGLEPSRLHVVGTGPGENATTLEFAPWAQEGATAPYFVHAETNTAGAVILRLPEGTVQISAEEFYELLEADPELPLIGRHRPLALLVPGLGTGKGHAQQYFAVRNDRTVWSYDGALVLSEGSATEPGLVTALPQPRREAQPGTPGTTAPGRQRPGVWRRTVPRLPSAEPAADADTSDAVGTAEWHAGADGEPPAAQPLPYSADGQFDLRFAETLEAFPVADSTDRHTVWGFGQDDPDFHVFAAEIPALGLRGEYRSEGPSAGGVTDMSGRVYTEGPAWDWYMPGRGLVASSRLLTVPHTPAPDGPPPVPAGWPATGPVSPTPPVDPATVAADPAALAGSTLPEALWRDHDAPLYRFSPDGPERVFREGLKPYGPEMVHLIDHVYGGSALVPHTVFASTTASRTYVRDSARSNPMGAPALYRRYRWRYDIQAPGGIDVNATLGLASPFPDQEEVLFPGGIGRGFIRGAQPMEYGVPVGPYVANPHFAPVAPGAVVGRTSVVDADFAGPGEPAAQVLESFPALSLDSDSD